MQSVQHWLLHAHVTTKAQTSQEGDATRDAFQIVLPDYLPAALEVGSPLTVFASFARIAIEDGLYCHSLLWGVCDVKNKRFVSSSSVDSLPVEQLEQLVAVLGDQFGDPNLVEALLEMRRKQSCVLPDTLLSECRCSAPGEALSLVFGHTRLWAEGSDYYLSCPTGVRGLGLELRLHGAATYTHDGSSVLSGVANGTLTIPTQHEWHNAAFDALPQPAPRAHWSVEGTGCCMLGGSSDGLHVTQFVLLFDEASSSSQQLCATLHYDEKDALQRVVASLGGQALKEDVSVVVTRSWISPRTFLSYSTEWTLKFGDYALTIVSVVPEQEAVCAQSVSGASWQGRVHVTGVRGGSVAVSGVGFVRQSMPPLKTMSALLSQVTQLSLGEVDTVMPPEFTPAAMLQAVASPERAHLLDGVTTRSFQHTLTQPLREIIHRRGKCWRGLGFLLCIDACGGNAMRFAPVLASIEILHVGSMIVDDVQDRSLLRRGGPACHTVLGEPLAINCGTWAYFYGISSALSRLPWLHPMQKLRYYEEYMLVLRAGHFGQALDICGLHASMEAAVQSGDISTLLNDIMAVHRLKTGVAAGGVARIGAALGGGSKEQQEGLGTYYEAVGLAFQIVDDVLNLSGFVEGQKVCGEDISEGKVTYPVVLALPKLSLSQREHLWSLLRSRPTEPHVIRECIDLIRGTGAFELAKKHANDMVHRAWLGLETIIPSSAYKAMLYSFGKFVLDRWY